VGDMKCNPHPLSQDKRAFNEVLDLLKQENFHALAVVPSKSFPSSRCPAVCRLTSASATKQFLLIGTWGRARPPRGMCRQLVRGACSVCHHGTTVVSGLAHSPPLWFTGAGAGHLFTRSDAILRAKAGRRAGELEYAAHLIMDKRDFKRDLYPLIASYKVLAPPVAPVAPAPAPAPTPAPAMAPAPQPVPMPQSQPTPAVVGPPGPYQMWTCHPPTGQWYVVPVQQPHLAALPLEQDEQWLRWNVQAPSPALSDPVASDRSEEKVDLMISSLFTGPERAQDPRKRPPSESEPSMQASPSPPQAKAAPTAVSPELSLGFQHGGKKAAEVSPPAQPSSKRPRVQPEEDTDPSFEKEQKASCRFGKVRKRSSDRMAALFA
jgi:hypothetical protein